MIPVIISGGSGTRLWPVSRKNRPKQFIDLVNDRSMFQNTLDRLEGAERLSQPIIVCNHDHRFMVADQLQGTWGDSSTILLEPLGRNTAPAIALAALAAETAYGGNTVLLVLPADHHIVDAAGFRSTVERACVLADQGMMVTFGIVPTNPETGYGYIRVGKRVSGSDVTACVIAKFVEKPDLITAQGYVSSGEYYWNSGMFMFQAGRYLEELGQHRPDILEVCREAYKSASRDLDFTRIPQDIFAKCPEDSIDYAVMEKTDRAVVVPLDVGWSDVGAWLALWELGSKDDRGNVSHGDVWHINSNNCYFHAESKMIAAVGVNNIVVVETPDGVMVVDRNRTQDVKKIVDQLKAAGRKETDFHREVHRPWGVYDSIDSGGRYQVKHITVKPGAKLSVQMHHHRAEHWVVVTGTAKVTVDGKEMLLTENQSTYIPIGAVHSLENPGKIPLEIIEVQSGAYLGEDDIVRFEDRYGRSKD
ncbi:MAG: mannose-1-phosphate guanylyltransferase/mannose-6-phosphate isomerase [Pseudomonadota bacterium]